MKTSDAIKHFGTAAELARALGIQRQSISGWGKTVPLARQYQIERLTAGKLKAPAVAPYRAESAAA
ncbi:MAG: Cro/CI family transcriptional regulator [Gammaproteobacteria bacterium]|nr:Cro/CI family transcriptional regulator [Gammaproteobacteria bacterium]